MAAKLVEGMKVREFDNVIVGGGTAGCVLAARLSEDPDRTVLLLEAGGRDRGVLFRWPAGFARMTKGMASWGWSTVPQRNLGDRRIWYTQAKVIGGGSSINAQIYTRGNARDYDAWARDFGCEGWSFREVLPYFRRSEDNDRFVDAYHATGGPIGVSAPRATLPICDAFLRAAQEFGIPYNSDFNGRRQRGAGFYQLTQRDGRRSSAATEYLKPVESRPNLHVLTDAFATRVAVEKGRAAGVEAIVRAHRDPVQFLSRGDVLVASGAIGSPRLLMLSGIGPAEHIESHGINVVADLPGVGSNLQDHLDLCAIAELTGPHSYDGWDRPHMSILAAMQYVALGTGPVAASLFETGAFWFADESARSPDIQFHLGQGSGIEKGIARIDGAGVTLNSALLRPQSRGTVRLASSDPAEPPLIDPDYWAEPGDREKALDGLTMAREILRQPALADFVRREALPGAETHGRAELAEYAFKVAKTDHHPVGTCKMGPAGDETAVVNPELRVRGVEGLRVCDASVMPAIVSSNTNAATLMIGEKGADIVRGHRPLDPPCL